MSAWRGVDMEVVASMMGSRWRDHGGYGFVTAGPDRGGGEYMLVDNGGEIAMFEVTRLDVPDVPLTTSGGADGRRVLDGTEPPGIVRNTMDIAGDLLDRLTRR